MQMLPEDMRRMIQNWGLDQIEFVWLGSAHRDGNAQLRLHIEMPRVGFRQVIPLARTEKSARIGSDARFLAHLALPTESEFRAAVEWVASVNNTSAEEVWNTIETESQEFNTALAEAGASFQSGDILRMADGLTVRWIEDGAGGYFTTRGGNAEATDRVLGFMADKSGYAIQTKTYAGLDVHHWLVPDPTFLLLPDKTPEEAPGMIWLTQAATPQYWVKEQGVNIVAGVPQILKDRSQQEMPLTAKSWLTQSGIALDDSVLLLAGKASHLPATAWHQHIRLMGMLGALAGVEVDLFNLPSAQELGLPQTGTLALSIESTPEALAAAFYMENDGMDLLRGGSSTATMSLVAATGILAAVAIPAYQDYTVRAEVSLYLQAMAHAKLEVAEHFQATQGFEDMKPEVFVEIPQLGIVVIHATAETGTLTTMIRHSEHSALTGGQLFMTPVVEAGRIVTWQCSSSDLPVKYLPAECR